MLNFSLSIMGNDWIIIAFVALFLLFGTKRMPEVSRKMGKLIGQYNKAKNQAQGGIQKATGYNLSVQGPVGTERQKLEMIARSLGIDMTNKTDDELRNTIASKLDASPSKPNNSTNN